MSAGAGALAPGATQQAPSAVLAGEQRAEFWRSLLYFNVYRSLVPVTLIAVVLMGGEPLFGAEAPKLFLWSMGLYAVFAAAAFVSIFARQPDFETQLTAHSLADVLFIVLAMHASGGIMSGLGLLLLASQAAAALISRGRMMLFYAAVGSLAVLAEQSYRTLGGGGSAWFVQAGLLSVAYFATAFVGRTLASYAVASEQLARQRGVDLVNLSQVNQLIIQDMQDGVLVVDEQGVIRQINRRAQYLLGLTVWPPASGTALADCAPALAAQVADWRHDPAAELAVLSVRDGEGSAVRQVGVRAVPVGTDIADGPAVIFLEDQSRIQKQAQQLKLAALGRLTANIAHEIRNPLSAINHATELLQEGEPQNETDERLLQIIHTNTQRIDGMVQEVLKLNRRDRVHREVVELVEYLPTFAREFCGNERIDPEVIQVQAGVPLRVQFDRSHLNQVMWNLCRNALRHGSQSAGSICIVVRAAVVGEKVEGVYVDVLDDGPGIAPAVQAHLFEPFFTTASSGTGLGLYLARELADANGATLEHAPGSVPTRFTLQCRSA